MPQPGWRAPSKMLRRGKAVSVPRSWKAPQRGVGERAIIPVIRRAGTGGSMFRIWIPLVPSPQFLSYLPNFEMWLHGAKMGGAADAQSAYRL